MKKRLIIPWFQLCFTIWLGIAGTLAADTIEKINIKGNTRVSRDTILFYMKSRPQGIYAEDQLREDFKALWKTGFFENITIESSRGTSVGKKEVTLTVEENPIIASVNFNTGKKVGKKDIIDKLQESSIMLTSYSYYNPSRMKKAERIIRELLLDKGYNQGTVSIKAVPKKNHQVALTIEVNQGHKTRIGAIEFPGLEKSNISPGFLIKAMKHNKEHSLFAMLGSKDVFSKEKVDEDLEAIRLRLQQKGFLEARIGQPKVDMVRRSSIFGKTQQMLRLKIPVETGPQYRVGDITLEGNKIIKKEFLQRFVTMKKGSIFNVKKRDKTREDIQTFYGNMGYIFCRVAPVENLDPVKKMADLTLKVNEGEVAYVGKLEFAGNTFTRDYVLRREWMLREGNRFNTGWLKSCITRMKQQGLVDIAKEPEFKPDPTDTSKMDITIHVKEMNRQNINFNFGYSGYDGLFGALGYTTHNFLGRGETLSASLQSGTRANQYRFSFSEPYLFDLPATFGFSVYKTSVDYPDYRQKRQGFDLSASARLKGFLNGSLRYSYEDVELGDIADSYLDDPLSNFYLRGGKISSLSPTIYYSTVNSPVFPSNGTKILFTYRYSGGFLGGDVNMHKTRLQLVKFIPVGKRHVLGMQFVHQRLFSFGDSFVPYYEKFLLGGEQSIRGFEMHRVAPRNAKGGYLGGNKAFFANFEYIVPLTEQFSFALFYDIGNAYDVGQAISLKNVYSSTGLEMRIFVPMLNVPFRLIFAYNPRTLTEEHSHFVFRFAVGTSFN